MIKALALDPGKTTGYCYADISKHEIVIRPGEAPWSLSELFAVLQQFKMMGKHVVYEDFVHVQYATGVDYTPVKMQGIIEYHAEISPKLVFYKQNPSVQGETGFYGGNRLKQHNAWWPHGKGHARSATRHMLHWLRFGAGAQWVDINKAELRMVE